MEHEHHIWEHIWPQIQQIIQQSCFGMELNEVKPESLLVSDLGMDSISITAVILKCEKIFNVELSGQDFNDSVVDTASDICELIGKKLSTDK